MKKILCVVGTRPEGIKMAPVIRTLKQAPEFDLRVLATAQHRDLLDQVLHLFDIPCDIDLNCMTKNQSLAQLTSLLVHKLDDILAAESPHLVLAQGDTTTVFTTALTCFYRQIPFGHVEAGLRTGQKQTPFPEEMNRVFASYLGDLHFAPTERAKQNLLREGIADSRIWVTGNTGIDALLYQAGQQREFSLPLDPQKKIILLTAHRRENFGAPFEAICRAIRLVADRFKEVLFLYPVHPNPHILEPARRLLSGHPRIILTDPLHYADFVAALQSSYLVLTDSGGVQEEAPALGKPVLVLRQETERPEAIDAGVVKLIGTDTKSIVTETTTLLEEESVYRAMAKGVSPYGDGHAAERIVNAIRSFLT